MMKQEFTIGPFTITPGESLGNLGQRFEVRYNPQRTAEIVTTATTQGGVTEAADDAMADIRRTLKEQNERTNLIRLTDGHGQTLSKFVAGAALPDMTPGLVDDRFDYWLKDESGKYSQVVTLGEFAALRAAYALPDYAWIAELLPDEVLTIERDEWRPPTAWEIRHLVGRGSFIGITGGEAAALVGVNDSSFRKYTAQEGAKSRQNMSFAMWHLLLHRLGVQTLKAGVV